MAPRGRIVPSLISVMAVTIWISPSRFGNGQEPSAAEPFNFEEESRDVPRPR